MVPSRSQVARFLRRFFSLFKSGKKSLAPEEHASQPASRSPPEEVCFAINERKKIGFDEKANRHFVKATKLLPRQRAQRWELSTFSIEGLAPGESWPFLTQAIGAMKPLAGKTLFRCDRDRNVIDAPPLKIDDNWEPPRHVDMIGWPEAEDAHLSIAQSLSDIGRIEFSPDFASTSKVKAKSS